MESIFNDMTSTIKASKHIITALLDELQIMQVELYKCTEKCKKLRNEDLEKTKKNHENKKSLTLEFDELTNTLGKGISNKFYEFVGSHEELQVDKGPKFQVNEKLEKYQRSDERTQKSNSKDTKHLSETDSEPDIFEDDIEVLEVVNRQIFQVIRTPGRAIFWILLKLDPIGHF